MPDELVAVSQAVLVDDAVLVHDDRVVHVRAERALAGARTFEILQETERASSADLFEKRLRREIHRHGLTILLQRGMLEIDLDVQAEAIMRIESDPLIAFLKLDALQHADETLRRAQ